MGRHQFLDRILTSFDLPESKASKESLEERERDSDSSIIEMIFDSKSPLIEERESDSDSIPFFEEEEMLPSE